MKVRMSELDLEICYKVARGKTYKQIAADESMSEQNIKNRARNLMRVFGVESITNLIATLIASDVLRLHDLYIDLDVEVYEYKREGGNRLSYRLTDVRM